MQNFSTIWNHCKKLAVFHFSDIKCIVIKPGSKCGKIYAMHKWQRTAADHESGVFCIFIHNFVTLKQCRPSIWGERKWQSVTACSFHVDVRIDVYKSKETKKPMKSLQRRIPSSLSLTKWNTKISPKKTQGEASLAMISTQQVTGNVSFVTAPAWFGWFQTHPVLQKALSVYKF